MSDRARPFPENVGLPLWQKGEQRGEQNGGRCVSDEHRDLARRRADRGARLQLEEVHESFCKKLLALRDEWLLCLLCEADAVEAHVLIAGALREAGELHLDKAVEEGLRE